MCNPLKKFYACIGNGDLAGALNCVHTNAVFEVQGPGSIPVYGVYKGREGVKRLLATLLELFDTKTFEFRKWAVGDDSIFAHGYMEHVVKKTGKIFQCEFALVCDIDGELISSCKMFEDTAALQSAYA